MTLRVGQRNAREAKMNIMTWYGLRDQNFECAIIDCENPYVEDTGDFDEHGWTCGRDDCFLNDDEKGE